MEETLNKWTSEFNIHNNDSEPTLFLLLKDYNDSFNKHKSNHIHDEQNRIIIDERVAKKSISLQVILDTKSDELSEMSEELNERNTICNNLYSELDSLKKRSQSEIDKAVTQSAIATTEYIKHLKSELDSLKSEREDILCNFIKEKNKSSYEAGVIGETEMLKILQCGSWDEVRETNKIDHSGDFIIKYKNKKYILDVKNYTDNVPGKEVRKLAKDIETTSCDGGAIISLNSGILNPNTNSLTQDKIQHITVSGKSILLLSNASLLNQDFINSSLKLLYCESSPNCNSIITDKCKHEIVKSIQKMEKELQSETKSFQNKITRKQNDLDNLKDTLKEIIAGFDELSEDDSPKPQNKISVPEMRKKLSEKGFTEEAKLKGQELKNKFKEFKELL